MNDCSTRGRSTRGRGLVQERSSQVICGCTQKSQTHVYNVWLKLTLCEEVIKMFISTLCSLRSVVALYEYHVRWGFPRVMGT